MMRIVVVWVLPRGLPVCVALPFKVGFIIDFSQ